MYKLDITGSCKYRFPNFDNIKRTSHWAKEHRDTGKENIFLKLATVSSQVLKESLFLISCLSKKAKTWQTYMIVPSYITDQNFKIQNYCPDLVDKPS